MIDVQLVDDHIGGRDQPTDVKELELAHLRQNEDCGTEIGVALDEKRLKHGHIDRCDGTHSSEIKDFQLTVDTKLTISTYTKTMGAAHEKWFIIIGSEIFQVIITKNLSKLHDMLYYNNIIIQVHVP